MYFLYIHYSGYCLFKIKEFEEIGHLIQSVRSSMNDNKKFKSIIKLKAFCGFTDINEANHDIILIKNNNIPPVMKKFIQKFNFKQNQSIGFDFFNLSSEFKKEFGLNIVYNTGIFEINRSIKLHIDQVLKNQRDSNSERKFLKALSHKNLEISTNSLSYGLNITNCYNLITDFGKNMNVKLAHLKSSLKPFYPELVDNSKISHEVLLSLFSIYFDINYEEGNINNQKFDDEVIKCFYNSINSAIVQEISPLDKRLIKDTCDEILKFSSEIKDCKKITCNITKNIAPTLNSLLTFPLLNTSSTDVENDAELRTAKLISTAGSLKKLSELPSTTIHTLTFKDSLLRKGKFINVPRSDADRIKSKQSKLLSNKAALASRLDFFSENKKCLDNYRDSICKSVTKEIKSWSNRKGISIDIREKDEINTRIRKLKLKRKQKKKRWLLRKKTNNSNTNKTDIDLEI